MRTPEEIKRGLECCSAEICLGKECPYWEADCADVPKDTLAYIRQLESQVEKLEKDIQRGRGEL